MASLPSTYQERRHGRRIAWVQAEHAEVIAGALLDGAGCRPLESGGRGVMMCFSYPGGEGLIRPYRRGGVMQKVFRDAYVLANRPRREFEIHRYLLDNGFRAPELLGICWERNGAQVRGAIATHRESAPNLLEALRSRPANADELLMQCGALIRRMHDLGVWHADLQVRNLLAGPEGPSLIDFDNASRRPKLSPALRARNLLRLRRSFEKQGLDPDYFERLCAGYGASALPGWLNLAYRGKEWVSDWLAGRR
jgi:3-deoxy-D-manno-octulosonic acid kinase